MLALVWVGCSGPGAPATDPLPETGVIDDTSVSSGVSPGVAGVLVDADGTPMPYVDVLCCQITTCAKGESDGDGAFWFAVEPGTEVALKTHEELFEVPRLAAALRPAVVPASGGMDVGDLYVPDLPSGVPLGSAGDPQVLQAGDGLELTLDVADLVPDFGVTLHDVAARRLPDDRAADYQGHFDDTCVEAVYAVHPFATSSTTPIGVRVPVDLADATPVTFFTISHLDGTRSAPARGHVEGGFATTDPGEGVTWLTYLVVTSP